MYFKILALDQYRFDVSIDFFENSREIVKKTQIFLDDFYMDSERLAISEDTSMLIQKANAVALDLFIQLQTFRDNKYSMMFMKNYMESYRSVSKPPEYLHAFKESNIPLEKLSESDKYLFVLSDYFGGFFGNKLSNLHANLDFLINKAAHEPQQVKGYLDLLDEHFQTITELACKRTRVLEKLSAQIVELRARLLGSESGSKPYI